MRNTIMAVFFMMSFFLNKSQGKSVPEVSLEHLKEDVTFLTSTTDPRNYKNLKALKEVIAYITKSFQKSTST